MKKYLFLFTIQLAAICCTGQHHDIATEHKALQGLWEMSTDTNVTIVFTPDSVKLLLHRKELPGYEATYTLSNTSCDTVHYGNTKELFLQETYSFKHSRKPHTMKTCSQITELTATTLLIKDNKLIVSYTKVKRK